MKGVHDRRIARAGERCLPDVDGGGGRVESENPLTGERDHACTAHLTFVAQDEHGLAVGVPPLALETDADRRRNAATPTRWSAAAAASPARAPARRGTTPASLDSEAELAATDDR